MMLAMRVRSFMGQFGVLSLVAFATVATKGEGTAHGVETLDVGEVGEVIISVHPQNGSWTLTAGDGSVQEGTGGAVLPGIPVGSISLTWNDIPFHDTPEQPSAQTLTENGAIDFGGTYIQHRGTVQINTIPLGASWSLLDGEGITITGSGASTIDYAPAGELSITWKPMAGYQGPEPATETKTLLKDQTITFEGVHTLPESDAVGNLVVLIEPEEALQDGASWALDPEGPWLDSGENVEVPVGIPEVSLLEIDHWIAGEVPIGPGWAWINGEQMQDPFYQWPTQGVPGSGLPFARQSATGVGDGEGNLWFFGGLSATVPAFHIGNLNDLWRYNIDEEEWTWMSGSSGFNNEGNFGSLGVPHLDNHPSGRNRGHMWAGPQNTLWLYGGESSGNDLWRYEIDTGLWTWMKGGPGFNPDVVYGTMGVPHPDNTPAITDRAAVWPDASDGKLWLYGGNSGNRGLQDDLWVYDIEENTWRWVNGSGSLSGWSSAVHGERGVPSASNTPGARYGSATWQTSDGSLWLFGGFGEMTDPDQWDVNTRTGYFADLWRFDLESGHWTWVSGSNRLSTGDDQMGELGVPYAEGPSPAGRRFAHAWSGEEGELWLYGGTGVHPEEGNIFMSDLWKYDIDKGTWTWLGGSRLPDEPAVYDTMGAMSRSNHPGGIASAVAVSSEGGNYLFSGARP
ncbi:MAG: hypothetical protein JJU11_02790, partial [Candidatus Sumerlaeia bacterium]|nr:hypothetical protein [Candidatus Sumerlaeia bacterium]